MAEQMITSYTSKGLFNADRMYFVNLKSNTSKAEFCTDLSDCRDSILAIVEIPSIGGGVFYLNIKSVDGGNDIAVKLLSEETNLVRITTKGIKDAEGLGHFEFTTDNGMSVTDNSIRVAFIKFIDVVNH